MSAPGQDRIAGAMLDLQGRRVALVTFMLRRNRASALQRLLLTPWLVALYARLLLSLSAAERVAAAAEARRVKPPAA